tara:strand:+ start:177 stop:1259 length:1083 start_codon:yes stop_codon:yes gene_type:complete
MFNEFKKKESPILSSLGMGGGIGSNLIRGASGPSFSASALGQAMPQETGGNQANANPKVAQTADGSVILASGNRNSVYRSTNNGQSWVQKYDGTEAGYTYGHGAIFINDAGTHAIASPRGSNFGKIIYSSDGGQSWNTKVTTNDSVYMGTYDQTTGIVMFGDRGQGGSASSDLNRSSNHGQSWSVAIDSGQSDHYAVGMKKGSAGEAVSWSTGKYYTSSNGGSSWTQQTTPTGHDFVATPYVVYNTSGRYFYKGSSANEILYADSGTGARTSTTISGASGTIRVVQIDSDDILYVAFSSGEIWYSTDNGASYAEIEEWKTYWDTTDQYEPQDINTNNTSGRFLVATRGSSGNEVHVLQKS